MPGSNTNKLKRNSLYLEWNEKSFASLLVRRLPFYKNGIDEYLKDPINAIRKQFPDEIFIERLKEFQTNHYGTNFYAYMVAVSFNRPRDFLMFCYAMRDRLSQKTPATFQNINSAETEYSDYFTQELKDELFLASRVLNFSSDHNKLINILSKQS